MVCSTTLSASSKANPNQILHSAPNLDRTSMACAVRKITTTEVGIRN